MSDENSSLFKTPEEELSRLQMPTLLINGEFSVIHNPQRALQRAIRLIPNLDAEFISDDWHILNAEKSELVNTPIFQFCSQ